MKRALLMLALATLHVGCAETDTGRLEGDLLVVRACDGNTDAIFDPYLMHGDFFALEQLGDVAFIRMQNGGKPLHRTDAFVIEVVGEDFVQQQVEGERKIFLDNPNVRATLSVLGSCPGTTQSMTAHEGFIKFRSFGSESGDRVEAEFEFQLFDDRTGEVVGLGFSGRLQFQVKVGQPYQPFAGKQ